MQNTAQFHRMLRIVVLIVFCLMPARAAAQAGISVDRNLVTVTIPEKAVYSLAAHSPAEIQSVTLIHGSQERSCQEITARQVLEFTPSKQVEVEHEIDFLQDGALLPGQDIWWQWEIKDAAGNVLLTDPLTMTVQDQRQTWQTMNNGVIQLQWYAGDENLGRKLIQIAADALARLESQTGIQYTEPIRIINYPDSEAVREVMVSTSEWAGAVAIPDKNLIMMAASYGSMDWAEDAIPHELSHLVVGRQVFNCRGGDIPTWLSEGLARHTEGPVAESETQEIVAALEQDYLPPLKTLEGAFSYYGGAAGLSYTQSHLVVAYLIETFGSEKMSDLLEQVRSGQLIEDALATVYGLDTEGLDAAWRESLGFSAPATQVSGPAATNTLVPTLALWTSVVQPSPSPSFTPSPSPEPTLTLTPVPPSATAAAEAVQPSATPLPTSTPAPPRNFCGSTGLAVLPLIWLAYIRTKGRK